MAVWAQLSIPMDRMMTTGERDLATERWLTMFGEGDALVPVPTMQRFQASFPHNELRSFGRCFSATAFSLFEAFLTGLRFAGGVSRGRPAEG